MAEIVKVGGASYHPSAANTGNEQPTVLRGKNMILRGSNGSYYFECFAGIKDLNEPIPMIELSGEISYTQGSLAIVGVGTDFKDELRFGQKFIAGDPTQVFVVEHITDAENMTVQRAPDETASGQTAYKLPHLFEINNQRGTLIWGNAIKFDRGNIIAVGEGRLRLNGDPLAGESLIASRRLKLAIFDPSTLNYTVDEMGFPTPPDFEGVSITVVAGGAKDMTQGFYSFRWAWADSRTGYGFSNPSEVIKLDASNNPIEIVSTNQRFRLDFTSGLGDKPVTADSIIVYRSLFSDPTQNVTQTGEGSWFVAKTIKIADLDPGDVLLLDVLDGELGTEVTFDNDVPPEADWVSVLAGDPILISCYGDTVVGGGDRGSAPGPFVSPSRRNNRHGFPAANATVLSPPEQIIGFSPAVGRLFLMTRVGLPFAAATGQSDFPVETRAFWATRFKSPYGLVFFNDTFYAFTVTGATRAVGTADKAQEQIEFSDAVSDITRNWFAGYVHAAYDPQNEMIVFIYSAAYRNDDGWWVSIALPFSLLHQCWMPIIEITKPDRDMIVCGAATVGSYLQFLAGGRGFVEELPEESSEEEISSEEESSEEEFDGFGARQWFRPEELLSSGYADGDRITTWVDHSSYEDDGTAQTSQFDGLPPLGPTISTDALNGLPVAVFTRQYYGGGVSNSFGSRLALGIGYEVMPGMEMILVLYADSPAGTGHAGCWDFSGGSVPMPSYNSANENSITESFGTGGGSPTIHSYDGDTVGAALSGWHIYQVSAGPDDFRAYLNNELVYSSVAHTFAYGAHYLGFSAQSAFPIFDYYFQGGIAEYIFWNRQLTDDEREEAYAYLFEKFGFNDPLTNPWTLHHTGHFNSLNPLTGGMFINANYFWLSGAYTSLIARDVNRKVRFTLGSDPNYSCGCWSVDASASANFWNTFSFSWQRRTSGNFKVIEDGVEKYDSGISAPTSWEIEVLAAGTVKYYINGSLVYTSLSSAPSTYCFIAQGGHYVFDPTFNPALGSGYNSVSTTAATIILT